MDMNMKEEEELLFSPMCLFARLLHKLGLAAPSWRLQGEAANWTLDDAEGLNTSVLNEQTSIVGFVGFEKNRHFRLSRNLAFSSKDHPNTWVMTLFFLDGSFSVTMGGATLRWRFGLERIRRL